MWLQPDGTEMTEEAWNKAKVHAIGMMLVGYAMDEVNTRGERLTDDTMLVLLNAGRHAVQFSIPKLGDNWEIIVSSQAPRAGGTKRVVESGASLRLEPSSSVVLKRSSP